MNVPVERSATSPRDTFRLLSWSCRGGLALVDQGLYAGAHFALSVLLARWLTPDDYGVFALAYSVFLFVGALYSALILEPMAVFGPDRYESVRPAYVRTLLRAHWAVTTPAAVVVAITGVMAATTGAPAVSKALWAVAATTPLMLFAWLTRRTFYLDFRPASAALGSGLYCTVVVCGTAVMAGRELLTPVTAILAMGLASGVSASSQLIRLDADGSRGSLRATEVSRVHWDYGRWALAAGVAMWVPLNVYYYVLPASYGLDETAALRALLNLASPLLQALVAVGFVLTPLLVRHRTRGGVRQMTLTVRTVTKLSLAGAVLYGLVVWTYRDVVLDVLYAGKYGSSGWAVAIVAALPIVACITTALGSALRALERPRLVFVSYAAFVLATVGAGIPMALRFGFEGALTGLMISYVCLAMAMFACYRTAVLASGATSEPLASAIADVGAGDLVRARP